MSISHHDSETRDRFDHRDSQRAHSLREQLVGVLVLMFLFLLAIVLTS